MGRIVLLCYLYIFRAVVILLQQFYHVFSFFSFMIMCGFHSLLV
jgi:hypothetical protein